MLGQGVDNKGRDNERTMLGEVKLHRKPKRGTLLGRTLKVHVR